MRKTLVALLALALAACAPRSHPETETPKVDYSLVCEDSIETLKLERPDLGAGIYETKTFEGPATCTLTQRVDGEPTFSLVDHGLYLDGEPDYAIVDGQKVGVTAADKVFYQRKSEEAITEKADAFLRNLWGYLNLSLGRRAEACQEKRFQITGGFGSSYYDKENFGIFLTDPSNSDITYELSYYSNLDNPDMYQFTIYDNSKSSVTGRIIFDLSNEVYSPATEKGIASLIKAARDLLPSDWGGSPPFCPQD